MKTKNPTLIKYGLKSFSQKQKYDRFIQLYMISFDAKESYRTVYDTNNEETIRNKSHLILKHPYVIKVIEQKNRIMDDKMSKKALMTREGVLEELQLILDKTKNNTKSLQTSLKALDQISKVIGAYAPVKNEVEHTGVTIKYVKPEDKA